MRKEIDLGVLDGIVFYSHDLRREERVLLKRQNGGGGVLVWGAFTENYVGELVILRGNQVSKKYVLTLSHYLVPFAAKEYNSE